MFPIIQNCYAHRASVRVHEQAGFVEPTPRQTSGPFARQTHRYPAKPDKARCGGYADDHPACGPLPLCVRVFVTHRSTAFSTDNVAHAERMFLCIAVVVVADEVRENVFFLAISTCLQAQSAFNFSIADGSRGSAAGKSAGFLRNSRNGVTAPYVLIDSRFSWAI